MFTLSLFWHLKYNLDGSVFDKLYSMAVPKILTKVKVWKKVISHWFMQIFLIVEKFVFQIFKKKNFNNKKLFQQFKIANDFLN
jgi:hypothetical protein